MPRVPTYDGPQVQQQAAPNVYQNPTNEIAAAGAAMGRATQQLGQSTVGLSDTMNKLRLQEDEVRAKEADVQFNNGLRDLLHGESGYYMMNGKDAVESYEGVQKQITELRKQVAANLTPSQARMFDDVANRRIQSNLDGMARYRDKELGAWQNATSEARMQDAMNDAMTAYNDPSKVRLAFNTGMQEVYEMAERNGWDGEITQAKLDAYRSGFHKSMIDRIMVDSPSGASAYYEANKDQILGEQQVVVEKALKASNDKMRAMEISDEIVSAGGTLKEQLDKAYAADKEIRDDVVSRVKTRFNDAETIRAEAERGLKNEAWKTILNGGTQDDIDAETWAALPAETQKSMLTYMEKGRQATTDWGLYYTLSQQYADSPREFAKVNLLDHINSLNETEFKQLAQWQRDARTGKEGEITQIRTVSGVVNDTIRNVFELSPTSTNLKESQKEKIGKFRNAVQQEINAFETAYGKKATPEDVQKMVDRLLIKTEGGWWGGEQFRFQIEEGEEFVVRDYDDIPASVVSEARMAIYRQKVREFEQRVGRPATDAEVSRITSQEVGEDAIINFINQNF